VLQLTTNTTKVSLKHCIIFIVLEVVC